MARNSDSRPVVCHTLHITASALAVSVHTEDFGGLRVHGRSRAEALTEMAAALDERDAAFGYRGTAEIYSDETRGVIRSRFLRVDAGTTVSMSPFDFALCSSTCYPAWNIDPH